MNHCLSQPHKPNFMSIVPRLAAALGPKHLWENHPVSSGYSRPALPISCFQQWKVPIYFCIKEDHVEGGQHSKYWSAFLLFEHENVKQPFLWGALKKADQAFSPESQIEDGVVPGPRQLALGPLCLCFAAFFARRLIKHDLSPTLPLARIYCTASIKKFWKYIFMFPNISKLFYQIYPHKFYHGRV